MLDDEVEARHGGWLGSLTIVEPLQQLLAICP
jgi:hypothetical protein